jgi:hypothetical protein
MNKTGKYFLIRFLSVYLVIKFAAITSGKIEIAAATNEMNILNPNIFVKKEIAGKLR